MAQIPRCCGCGEARGYCSDSTPSLGTSICCWCSPKKTKYIYIYKRYISTSHPNYLANLSVKGQIVNISVLWHKESILTTQLCLLQQESSQGQYRNKQVGLCSTKLYLQKQVALHALLANSYSKLIKSVTFEGRENLLGI